MITNMWLFLYELFRFLLINLYENVKFFYHQGFRDGRNRIPSIGTPLLTRSATQLAEMIASNDVTSEEVVSAFISRARAVNPMLNAIADERFSAALQEAKMVDRMLENVDDKEALLIEKPFIGVPFTAKESVAFEGLCNCVGCFEMSGKKCTVDSDCVKAMKEAGAIAICCTTIPEASLWIEASSLVHGRTNNPYDIHRTCGGSSGGEGALLGAAGSVIGIGTDLSGSIRTPALWCGIFGHKPTQGIVSLEEIYPKIDGPITDFATAGPMVRYAEDLLPMMKVLTKGDEKLQLDRGVDISSLTIHCCEDEGSSYVSCVSSEMRECVTKVSKFLSSEKHCETKSFRTSAFSHTFDLYLAKLEEVGTEPFDHAFSQDGIHVIKQICKKISGQSNNTAYSILLPAIEQSYRKTCDKIRQQQDYEELQQLERILEEALGEDGVLILPPQLTPAPFHHGTYLYAKDYLGIAGIFNILNLPMTVCPVGLSSKGLPLSVGVVAARYNDRLTIQVAREIEKKFGGWIPPCSISC